MVFVCGNDVYGVNECGALARPLQRPRQDGGRDPFTPGDQAIAHAGGKVPQERHGATQVSILARGRIDVGQQLPAGVAAGQQRSHHLTVAAQELGCHTAGLRRPPLHGLRDPVEQHVGHAGERRCDDDKRTLVTCDEGCRLLDLVSGGQGCAAELPDLQGNA